MNLHRARLIAGLALVGLTVALTTAVGQADRSRVGATRAAKRPTVAYVKRFGIVLHFADLDLQCSVTGRSRWKCFVYANGGQCTGTLTEVYLVARRVCRPRNIDLGCGE